MSVPESKRGEGKFSVLTKTEDLMKYTLHITQNSNRFDQQYRDVVLDRIDGLVIDIFEKCWRANNIKVGDSLKKWEIRRDLEDEALLDCDDLLAVLQVARALCHVESKRMKYWTEKIRDVKTTIKKWHDSDCKRYSCLEPKK